MSELIGFPMLSQRDNNVNAGADCVPTSIAACLEWLTNQKFSGGGVKDAVYGASYVGGTAALQYVTYCASHGVKLSPVNGNGGQLVQDLRNAIEHQMPCLITEPSSLAGWTHVCAAYKCDTNTITVMDPWLDAPVTQSNDYWAGRLEFNQIWTLIKIGDDMSITIDSPGVANYFSETDANHWQGKNGHSLQYAILDFYKKNNGLALFGLPLSNEVSLDANGNVIQYMERAALVYDPQHVHDSPPGAGSVYTAHVYDIDDKTKALGQDPYIAKLLAMIQQLQAQQPTVDQSAADKLDKIKTIVNS